MANLTFRLPGAAPYSYVEVSFDTDLRLAEPSELAEELKTALATLDATYPEAARSATTDSAPSSAAAAESPDPLRSCVHGPRKLKEGTSAGGKAWGAWMCQERDRANQCKPLDFITGKPWGGGK